MGAQKDGSWRDIQQRERAALMARTAPVGQRIMLMGQVRCVRCNDAFTAAYVESTGRALIVAGGVQQSHTLLRLFCFACNWSGTPEEAQRWLAEHKKEVDASGPGEAPSILEDQAE